MRILVCVPLSKPHQDMLMRSLQGHDVVFAPDGQAATEAQTAFHSSEAVFGNPPAAWLMDGRQPRWIQLESVGFGEYVEVALAAGPDLPSITNLAGFFSDPVAESMLAGILAFFRGLDVLQGLQRQRRWVGDDLRPRLRVLTGSEVVMIGRGAINGRLAELLAPFGCRLKSFGSDAAPLVLDAALREADVVACCVPHTDRTANLFNQVRLSLLKPDALFLNFGRGSLVDETALAEALDSGRLGGAIIDVTQEEPLPTNHRFWKTSRLTLTQHTAGGSSDETDRKIRFFLENFSRYKSGAALLSPVDFKRGY